MIQRTLEYHKYIFFFFYTRVCGWMQNLHVCTACVRAVREFNLKKELFKYTRKWKWFLLCIVLFVTGAFYSARYSPVIYETNARIKITSQKANEIELPGNLSTLFDDFKVNQENEIEIIKSYRILEKVVEKLDLNIRY